MCTLSKILEILDPGCDGKLLLSKVTRDEIPQGNYDNLTDFVDSIDPINKDGSKVGKTQEPENCFGGPKVYIDEDDYDISEDNDDDIQVRMG